MDTLGSFQVFPLILIGEIFLRFVYLSVYQGCFALRGKKLLTRVDYYQQESQNYV